MLKPDCCHFSQQQSQLVELLGGLAIASNYWISFQSYEGKAVGVRQFSEVKIQFQRTLNYIYCECLLVQDKVAKQNS